MRKKEGSSTRKRKYRGEGAAAAAVLGILLSVSGIVRAEETGETAYQVYFVDAEDHNTKIFNTQQGTVPKGRALRVSFPEQIAGSDGHIWRSMKQSPQEFSVYQDGTHKYYIEYQQGERIKAPKDPEETQKKQLEQWLQKAWEADCALTGQSPDGIREPDLIVTDSLSNKRRIRNLVSAIQDAGWHYFYLIGRDYTPETAGIGTEFDAVYSAVSEEVFSVEDSRYEIYRVGVKRNWDPDVCTHDWMKITQAANGCMEYGEEAWQCGRCRKRETVLLPALGHVDENGDSLCDRCRKRAFFQEAGSRIFTVLQMETGERPLSFTCVDENYRGTGDMLYLADEVLDGETIGLPERLFDEADYDNSPVRQYLNMGFSNGISLAGMLQTIPGTAKDGMGDLAVLLSEEEYEAYELMGRIAPVQRSWALRSGGEKLSGIKAVASDGTVAVLRSEQMEESGCGIRPAVLLKTPEIQSTAEKRYWKEGDIQMRRVGKEVYRFRCVDEDYSDAKDGHRKSALFLCDRVIQADIDGNSDSLKLLYFGDNNNYKASEIRRWLNENSRDTSFEMEPAFIGVDTAYTGQSGRGMFGQLSDRSFTRHEIGFQLMQDRLFCLSLEEALKYREVLWSFGEWEERGTEEIDKAGGAGKTGGNGNSGRAAGTGAAEGIGAALSKKTGSPGGNPQSQLSAYSVGYYLRTPFYEEDADGNFCYTDRVYAVDLAEGSIHPVDTDSETYGIRPAFTLPQE